jgi:hypothetical protein
VNRFDATRSATADILRYSVSFDKIEKVSSLSVATGGATALAADDGTSIYYFGGTEFGTLVQKFDTLTNLTVQLPTRLPSGLQFAGGVSFNGTIYIFDGQHGSILQFNEESETTTIIGHLPFQLGTGIVTSTTVLPFGKDSVWIFAGNDPKASNPILNFNMTSNSVSIPSLNTSSLPTLYLLPSGVSDGKFGYLIGGLGRAPESNGSYHPSNGILR